MYDLRFHKKVDKELSRLPKEVRKRLKRTLLPKIAGHPRQAGKPLGGGLAGYWRLDFKVDRVDYRVAYQIVPNDQAVYILMIRKRESFYERLKKRLS